MQLQLNSISRVQKLQIFFHLIRSILTWWMLDVAMIRFQKKFTIEIFVEVKTFTT